MLLEEEEEKEEEEAKGDTILINERESGARARRKEGRKEGRIGRSPAAARCKRQPLALSTTTRARRSMAIRRLLNFGNRSGGEFCVKAGQIGAIHTQIITKLVSHVTPSLVI